LGEEDRHRRKARGREGHGRRPVACAGKDGDRQQEGMSGGVILNPGEPVFQEEFVAGYKFRGKEGEFDEVHPGRQASHHR